MRSDFFEVHVIAVECSNADLLNEDSKLGVAGERSEKPLRRLSGLATGRPASPVPLHFRYAVKKCPSNWQERFGDQAAGRPALFQRQMSVVVRDLFEDGFDNLERERWDGHAGDESWGRSRRV